MDNALIIKLVIFGLLVVVGWLVGSQIERRHLRDLSLREQRYAHIGTNNLRLKSYTAHGQLICSNVVISHDYFKYVLAQIYGFLGGRIHSYESLMQRAQREAIVRLKQQTAELGMQYIAGLRLETTQLSDQGGMVEVLAYGTALYQPQLASHTMVIP